LEGKVEKDTTLDELNREHQGSRRVSIFKHKATDDTTNLPKYVRDNIGFRIDELLERRRKLLVELNEINNEITKHTTLSGVVGL
jgi:hypothetical protein